MSHLCTKTLPILGNLAMCFSTFQLSYTIKSEPRIKELSAPIYQRSVQTGKITEGFPYLIFITRIQKHKFDMSAGHEHTSELCMKHLF
jgi:hypothetical protein